VEDEDLPDVEDGGGGEQENEWEDRYG